MTKNIVIAVLALGLVMSLIFGVNQQTESKRQEALAMANAAEATALRDAVEMASKEAEMQRKLAIRNAMEAENQRQAAEDALEKCRKNK